MTPIFLKNKKLYLLTTISLIVIATQVSFGQYMIIKLFIIGTWECLLSQIIEYLEILI
ncbi:MAG TPA: hypothetical protein VF242_12420 [Nitrososphaeraceae archaeon]